MLVLGWWSIWMAYVDLSLSLQSFHRCQCYDAVQYRNSPGAQGAIPYLPIQPLDLQLSENHAFR